MSLLAVLLAMGYTPAHPPTCECMEGYVDDFLAIAYTNVVALSN